MVLISALITLAFLWFRTTVIGISKLGRRLGQNYSPKNNPIIQFDTTYFPHQAQPPCITVHKNHWRQQLLYSFSTHHFIKWMWQMKPRFYGHKCFSFPRRATDCGSIHTGGGSSQRRCGKWKRSCASWECPCTVRGPLWGRCQVGKQIWERDFEE